MLDIFLFERILRNREQFYRDIREKGVLGVIAKSIILIAIFGVLYGATMGVWSWEIQQIIFSAIKVPLLFLISISVVLPSYYVVNLAMGGRSSFSQLAALYFSSFSISTTVLLAFVPVNLFFIITSPRDSDSYYFMVFLNLIIYGIGGLISIVFMIEGALFLNQHENSVTTLRDLIAVAVSLGILAFIGTQLAWFIRPWFNYEPNFIRPDITGNFYTEIAKFAFSRLYFGSGFFIIVALVAFPFLVWIIRKLHTIPLK